MAAAARPYEIPMDAIYPRDAEHRYRIYERLGDDLRVLACAPDPASVGVALFQMHEDVKEGGGEGLRDCGVIGILDAVESEWIVLPWERGRASRGDRELVR